MSNPNRTHIPTYEDIVTETRQIAEQAKKFIDLIKKGGEPSDLQINRFCDMIDGLGFIADGFRNPPEEKK